MANETSAIFPRMPTLLFNRQIYNLISWVVYETEMFGEKAFELVRELHRSQENLPAFNDEGIRQVLEEIQLIFDENQKDVYTERERQETFTSTVYFRHTAFERNKRCLIAYLYNRLRRIRQMRWDFGSILPAEVKVNLTNNEFEWFTKYSKSLAAYMETIGENTGLNLTQDMKPPKSLYIEVRCMVDFGKFELHSGEVILLRKNGVHLLPRSECETLIRQGVLEHII